MKVIYLNGRLEKSDAKKGLRTAESCPTYSMSELVKADRAGVKLILGFKYDFNSKEWAN